VGTFVSCLYQTRQTRGDTDLPYQHTAPIRTKTRNQQSPPLSSRAGRPLRGGNQPGLGRGILRILLPPEGKPSAFRILLSLISPARPPPKTPVPDEGSSKLSYRITRNEYTRINATPSPGMMPRDHTSAPAAGKTFCHLVVKRLPKPLTGRCGGRPARVRARAGGKEPTKPPAPRPKR
jgi:hypothetical protein